MLDEINESDEWEVSMRFKYKMQVVAIEHRPARNTYPASVWALLADGEGEPLTFRVGSESEPLAPPPVFTVIDADISIVGRSFGQKKTTSYTLHGYEIPKG
jgi:hypothetical protein